MTGQLVELVLAAASERSGGRPFVVGIAGGVGVGKTTLADALAADLSARGFTAVVLATDNFLFPNAELAARGLLMQKGFPETYDVELIRTTIDTLRSGRAAEVPRYDHQTYDIVAERMGVTPSDVVVLEGVNVLQPGIADLLDLSIYVDVDVEHSRRWFLERFAALAAAGEGFYAPFAAMSPLERDAVADAAWNGINLVNLEQHIVPTRDAAHVVIRKDGDHSIREVRVVPVR